MPLLDLQPMESRRTILSNHKLGMAAVSNVILGYFVRFAGRSCSSIEDKLFHSGLMQVTKREPPSVPV